MGLTASDLKEVLLSAPVRGLEGWVDYFCNDFAPAMCGLERASKQIDMSRAIICDMGAHAGTWSILAAKLYKPKRIFAFEPNAGNYYALLQNIIAHGLADTVTAFNLGVSNYTGAARMFSQKNNSGGTFTIPEDLQVPEGAAGTVSLADMVTWPHAFMKMGNDRIDFLKMDIEGMEYVVEPLIQTDQVMHLGIEVHGDPLKAPGTCERQMDALVEHLIAKWGDRVWIGGERKRSE